MKRLSIFATILLAAAGIGLAACSGSDGSDDDNGNNNNTQTKTLTLDFSGSSTPLPDLGEDYQWEGWLIMDGPKSTGTFKASDLSSGTVSFDVDSELASSAERFVLTIEPKPDSDPAPSATKYLAGPISDGSADLSTSSVIADFSSASGQFALKAPTSSNAPDDDNMGIWFINPDGNMPPPAGFSDLPDLSGKGWNYEGWVVDTSGSSPKPYTTGVFADNSNPATSADQDGAGEFAGSNSEMFPPRPGSDFITSGDSDEGFDLTSGDWRVVVSVEPQPDNSDKPFALKPWAADIDSGASTGTAMSLSYNGSSLPTGTVTID